MGLNPYAFRVTDCDKAIQGDIQNSTQTGSFLSELGKLGQIQALNTGGGIFSNISNGISTLANISNTVEQGAGSPFSFIDDVVQAGTNAISAGANAVLSTVGINPNTLQSVLKNFNPGAVNSAINTAQNLYNQVSTGNFSADQIPSALQSLNSVEQNIQGIYTSSNALTGPYMCAAYPYAMDLINKAPKYKFMFIVQFIMNSPNEYSEASEFAFVIKHSTRPEYQFEYEDVNYNNFRTKVLKHTKFEEMRMKFYDDDTNTGTQFLQTYINQMIPITNVSSTAVAKSYQYNGMNFNKVPTSSSSPTNNDNFTPISQINLYHIYRQGRLMNVFQFFNPKLTKITFDDLSMEEGTSGNELDITFQYDNVLLYADISTSPTVNPQTNITDLTQGGSYPLQYVGSSTLGSSINSVSFNGGILNTGSSGSNSGSNLLGGLGSAITGGGSGSNGGILGSLGSGLTGVLGAATSGINSVMGLASQGESVANDISSGNYLGAITGSSTLTNNIGSNLGNTSSNSILTGALNDLNGSGGFSGTNGDISSGGSNTGSNGSSSSNETSNSSNSSYYTNNSSYTINGQPVTASQYVTELNQNSFPPLTNGQLDSQSIPGTINPSNAQLANPNYNPMSELTDPVSLYSSTDYNGPVINTPVPPGGYNIPPLSTE